MFTATRAAAGYLPIGGTWNPSDKGTATALTNGDLTATMGVGSAADSGVRGTVSKLGGSWQWEITLQPNAGTGTAQLSGVCTSTPVLTATLYSQAETWLVYNGNGNKYIETVISGFDSAQADDDILTFGLKNGVLRMKRNGTLIGIIASGLGGWTLFPAWTSATNQVGPNCTANFDGPFTYPF